MTEVWKSIPDYVGRYEVSNLGRVRSLPNSRRKSVLILKQQCHIRTGYMLVNLTGHDGKKWFQKVYWVARLVCAAFHGPCPLGFEACHCDGDKTNNVASNLRWDSHTANQADRVIHGTSNIGSANPMARLSEPDVRAIKTRLKNGDHPKEIATDHSVALATIKNIKNGYNWKHIDV